MLSIDKVQLHSSRYVSCVSMLYCLSSSFHSQQPSVTREISSLPRARRQRWCVCQTVQTTVFFSDQIHSCSCPFFFFFFFFFFFLLHFFCFLSLISYCFYVSCTHPTSWNFDTIRSFSGEYEREKKKKKEERERERERERLCVCMYVCGCIYYIYTYLILLFLFMLACSSRVWRDSSLFFFFSFSLCVSSCSWCVVVFLFSFLLSHFSLSLSSLLFIWKGKIYFKANRFSVCVSFLQRGREEEKKRGEESIEMAVWYVTQYSHTHTHTHVIERKREREIIPFTG